MTDPKIDDLLKRAIPDKDWKLMASWKEEDLQLGLDQLQRLLDRYYSSKDTVATRAGVILGAAAAALAAFFALSPRLAGGSLDLLYAAAVLSAASLILSLLAYASTTWDFVPDPTTLTEVLDKEKSQVQRLLVIALRDACLVDARKLNYGGGLVNASLAALGAGVVLAALAVFA